MLPPNFYIFQQNFNTTLNKRYPNVLTLEIKSLCLPQTQNSENQFLNKVFTHSLRKFSLSPKLSWSPTTTKNIETIKFLCSYGGKILPSYTDDTFCYAGGPTCVLAIDRSISFIGLCALPFSDSIFVNSFGFLWIINQNFFLVVVTKLMVKLREFYGSLVNLWCQLPTDNLETLISITFDDRLRHNGWRSYLRWRPVVDSQSFLLRPFVPITCLSLSVCFLRKKKLNLEIT